ncbi:MAG TPA: hypothetical protein VGA17_10875 [Nitrospiraceae bacterium]|jgi:hypothetical protein
MSASQGPYSSVLRDLSSLMVAVSGESVTMIKRSAPEQAMKIKKSGEWEIYLEFLQLLFNLADRLSAHYIPLKDQPIFMDGLEDAVTQQLKNVLAPALGPDTDEMEVVLAIGATVAQSRERYERFKFLVTEDSQQKEEYFKTFGETVAHLVGAQGDGVVISAATLCGNAVIPAMKGLLESATPGAAQTDPAADARVSPAMGGATGNEIKLISIMSTIQGEEIETRWGLHPRFRQDLTPEQKQELNKLMNRVSHILGSRYASVAFSPEWSAWHQQAGNA